MRSSLFLFSLAVFFCSFPSTNQYKYLVYSPQFASSHVNFLGKISDTLVDAGHDVVILSPKVDRGVKSAGSKKARIIEFPFSEITKTLDASMGKVLRNVWTSPSPLTLLNEAEKMLDSWIALCNETLHQPGLLEQLRAEQFDAAYSEALDYFGMSLFNVLGIEKYAVTNSFAAIDGKYHLMQVPSFPSYVPATLSGYGDAMTFWQRLVNTVLTVAMSKFGDAQTPRYEEMFRGVKADFPPIAEIIANVSLVFLNSDPLLNFQRPIAQRIIDIGGITVTGLQPNKLNETWSAVLNRRARTIYLSFGTFVTATAMPDEYKQAIREAFTKFPDVTFIWKYEKPEDRVSEGIDNIFESTWVPQVDLLNDPRLTAFMTHGGQGSLAEATAAGVPLICIPVASDQMRNGAVVKKNKIGVVLQKEELADSSKIEAAIRAVLEDNSYTARARHVAQMLKERPFDMRDIFVKNMEFLAKYGPLRMLDHYGTQLNFFQFYLIDVFAFLGLISVTVISIIVLVVTSIIRCIYRRCLAAKTNCKTESDEKLLPPNNDENITTAKS